MPTLTEALIEQARAALVEPEEGYWTDDELLAIANRGYKDLWGAIVDLHEDFYFTNDETNVSLAALTSTLTGVPADVMRVLLIEPRDVSDSGPTRAIRFVPKKYNHADTRSARRLSPRDPSGPLELIYSITNAGAPVGAPTIYIAPQVTSTVLVKLTYIPTIGNKASDDPNPIPGESDNAIIAWIVAWARAKEREDRSPDPSWISAYATEKKNICVRLAPREEQEPHCVEGIFDSIAYADDDL